MDLDLNKQIEDLKLKKQKEKLQKIFTGIERVLIENEATLADTLLSFGELGRLYQGKAGQDYKIK